MMGKIKAGLGTLIGNAGEYFVVAELLRRGIVAAMAPRNTPGFDVLATDGSRSVNIRVKTRTAAADSWVWIAKKDGTIFGKIGENDFPIAVDLGDVDSAVQYYVFRTKDVDRSLNEDFNNWKAKPGLGGKPHNPENKQRRMGDREPYRELLASSRDRWDLIENCLNERSIESRFSEPDRTSDAG